jgi:hypothetical protein
MLHNLLTVLLARMENIGTPDQKVLDKTEKRPAAPPEHKWRSRPQNGPSGACLELSVYPAGSALLPLWSPVVDRASSLQRSNF